MAARDIRDKEGLERWLTFRPSEYALVVALRAALRVVPAFSFANIGKRTPDFLLAAFRANAVAYATAEFPDRARTLRDTSYSAARAAAEAAARAGAVRPLDTAGAAAHTALAAARAAKAAYAAACGSRSESARAAAEATAEAAYAGGAVVWDKMRGDGALLEHGPPSLSAGLAKELSPGALAALPLWPDGAPHWAAEHWDALKTYLLARPTDHWDVWIDWYEARLRGEAGNMEEEIARILEVTEEEWAAGPAVANKKIKDIVARFRGAPSAVATTRQITTPSATIKAHAFISHATQADGARASVLTRDLEAVGIPCWIAPRDIPSGADWNGAIMSAIDACGAMILLVSDAALTSPFVKAEVQHAFEKGKRVFPIRLADSIEAGQIDLRLKIVQHIDGRGETQTIVASILNSLG